MNYLKSFYLNCQICKLGIHIRDTCINIHFNKHSDIVTLPAHDTPLSVENAGSHQCGNWRFVAAKTRSRAIIFFIGPGWRRLNVCDSTDEAYNETFIANAYLSWARHVGNLHCSRKRYTVGTSAFRQGKAWRK